MIEEIRITGDCLEGLGIPNGGIAVVDREKVYENACAGCTRHGEKPGECYHDEPCERLISAFTTGISNANINESVATRREKQQEGIYGNSRHNFPWQTA